MHSPVEGKHPHLADSIEKGIRWIGGYPKKFVKILEKNNIRMRVVGKPEYTEWLKLRSTTLYGLNIEYARYSKKVSNELDMPFDFIKEFDQDYNELYEKLDMPQFKRYILSPPRGKIGGHCVVPNAHILDSQYPDILVKRVYNQMRVFMLVGPRTILGNF